MNVKVTGGAYLKGNVVVSGAKNAAIPLLCASLLAKGKVLFRNVPHISDIYDLLEIIKKLNCRVVFKGHTLLIDNTNLTYCPLLFEECGKMRGSYYLIGVFLTLFAKCEIMLPGGCKIGHRPIDIHLQAFQDLGYDYTIEEGILYIRRVRSLDEASIYLKNKSVGATINALFASLGLEQVTIQNALIEPEGADVIQFLNQIGYEIKRDKEMLLYHKKALEFKFIKHTIIPDRMEAMTYAILGLLTGNITVKKVNTEDLKLPLKILEDSGFDIHYTNTEIQTKKSIGKGFEITTDVYPGFPTDLQPLFGVLSIHTEGKTVITETVFENRMHIYYDLLDSGVECFIKDNRAVIEGTNKLISKNYKAYDLRHGAALVLLALLDEEESLISNFDYILRGYDNILSKLKALGATIFIAS